MSLPERDFILDELGDPNAPVGSRLWCLWVANEIRKAIYDKQQTDDKLRELVESFKEHQGYQELGFMSWEDFCNNKLQKPATEVESAIEAVQRRAENPPELREPGRPPATNGKHDNYNSLSVDQQGTSADYLTARIARDAPDVLDRMKAGEFRSVRQAAIEAGIINPQKRYNVSSDPEKAGAYFAERVDRDWMEAMLDTYYRNLETP